MGVKVLEGRWEDVAKKVQLAGRNVRVVFHDGSETVTLAEIGTNTSESASSPGKNPWLKQLIDFSNSHQPVAHEIDLDQDRLFKELHGDPG